MKLKPKQPWRVVGRRGGLNREKILGGVKRSSVLGVLDKGGVGIEPLMKVQVRGLLRCSYTLMTLGEEGKEGP